MAALLPENIRYLIIHCTDSAWGSLPAVTKWHTDKVEEGGRGWPDIGYHWLITNGYLGYAALKNKKRDAATDGAIFVGRDLDHDGIPNEDQGAHCVGYNSNSLGICLVGQGIAVANQNDPDEIFSGTTFTEAQFRSLTALCLRLMKKYNIPVTNILGHRETASGKAAGKTCPDFDVAQLRASLSEMESILDVKVPFAAPGL